MSCIPPEQMPMDEHAYDIALYPNYFFGINQERRVAALVLSSAGGAPSPALVYDEQQLIKLVLQAQSVLRVLSALPVPPSDL